MSCGTCFEDTIGSGSGHGVSKMDAIAGGGSGLPRRDAAGVLRCINPSCSRRPRVKANAACKQCGSTLHCAGAVEDNLTDEQRAVLKNIKTQVKHRIRTAANNGVMPKDVSNHVTGYLQQRKRKEQRDTEIASEIDDMIGVYSDWRKFPPDEEHERIYGHLQGTELTHLPVRLLSHDDTLKELNLASNQLTELPAEIGRFSELEVLNLSGNAINQLPDEIGQLTNLHTLVLDDMPDLRTLPQTIIDLPNLRKIQWTNGNLIEIPSEVTNLRNVSTLNLSGHKIESIDGVGSMEQLEELDLSNNRITQLKDEDVSELGRLEQLRINNNPIGKLPKDIRQLVYLQKLDAGGTRITSLPNEIGELENLVSLNVSSSSIGHLPKTIGRLSELREMYVSFNALHSVPPEIGELTNLEILSLSHNNIEELPEDIGDLIHLKELSLESNQLNTIPQHMTTLPDLKELNLRSNQLTELPSFDDGFCSLETLRIDENRLTQLPDHFVDLHQLQVVNANKNWLIDLPEDIGTMTLLKEAHFGNNRLSSIPTSIGADGASGLLSYVDMGNNRILLDSHKDAIQKRGKTEIDLMGNPIATETSPATTTSTGVKVMTSGEAKLADVISGSVKNWLDQLSGKSLSPKIVSGLLVGFIRDEKKMLGGNPNATLSIFEHVENLIDLYSDPKNCDTPN